MGHEVLERLVIKLSGIIGHEVNRDSETGDNILPNELLALFGGDRCGSLCLYLLGEVINCHNHMLFFSPPLLEMCLLGPLPTGQRGSPR